MLNRSQKKASLSREASLARQWVRDNPLGFAARLKIETKQGKTIRLDKPTPSQVQLMALLMEMKRYPGDPDGTVEEVVALKPRQVHYSTTNDADTFSYTFGCEDPVRSLYVTDCQNTTDSLFLRKELFYLSLPDSLQAVNPMPFNHTRRSILSALNARIDHLTAGGRSKARSWTYQRLIAEELAFWPNAQDVWSSATSTLDEGAPIIVVSTPDGPGNLYHQKVLAAQKAREAGRLRTRLIFMKWSDHVGYQKRVPRDWEPTEEEYRLLLEHGLTLEQLYWRHDKIWGVKGIGQMRFRREYPLTEEDGFLVLQGAWFDADYLNRTLNGLPAESMG